MAVETNIGKAWAAQPDSWTENRFPRVMEVVSNLDIGGGQEVVRTLVENLADLGCRPVVCTFADGPLRPEIERLGIPVVVLPDRRHGVLALPWFLRDMLATRRALRAVIRAYDIDVLQTQLLRVLDFLVLSLRLDSDVAVYWTFQNAEFTLREDHLARHKWLLRPKQLAYRWLYRITQRWVDGLIAVSTDVKRALIEQFAIRDEKIAVICNSVDVRRYGHPVDRTAVRASLRLPPEACMAAVVATFKRQKGHRYLIDAAAQVIDRFPNLHLLFIGDGELRHDLQARTRSAGLSDHVHFLGWRQDIPELLAASDYFVLPSLWEGLPMALIEAMASGLPVIATNVSGSRQVVVDGESGLLVEPGDVPALANAMIRTLAAPEAARAMGRTARQRVATEFSAQKQARDHLALFCAGGLAEPEYDTQQR